MAHLLHVVCNLGLTNCGPICWVNCYEETKQVGERLLAQFVTRRLFICHVVFDTSHNITQLMNVRSRALARDERIKPLGVVVPMIQTESKRDEHYLLISPRVALVLPRWLSSVPLAIKNFNLCPPPQKKNKKKIKTKSKVRATKHHSSTE